jgi:hypothetical protein
MRPLKSRSVLKYDVAISTNMGDIEQTRMLLGQVNKDLTTHYDDDIGEKAFCDS